MIQERDLLEAIAECQGERNPNAHTCIKLAAYYTIKSHLFPERTEEPAGYSLAAEPAGKRIRYDSGSEFSEAIRGRDPEDVWPVIDELMTAIRVLMPRLYDGVMARVSE